MSKFAIRHDGINALSRGGEGRCGEVEEAVEEVGALCLREVLPVGDGGALGEHVGDGVRDAFVQVLRSDVCVEEFYEHLLGVCILRSCGYGKDGVVASAKGTDFKTGILQLVLYEREGAYFFGRELHKQGEQQHLRDAALCGKLLHVLLVEDADVCAVLVDDEQSVVGLRNDVATTHLHDVGTSLRP